MKIFGINYAMLEEELAYERRLEMGDLLDFQRFAESLPRPKPESVAAEK